MWTDTCSSETERNVRSSRIKGRMRSLELLDNQEMEGEWSSVGRWLEVLMRYRDFSEQKRRTAQNIAAHLQSRKLYFLTEHHQNLQRKRHKDGAMTLQKHFFFILETLNCAEFFYTVCMCVKNKFIIHIINNYIIKYKKILLHITYTHICILPVSIFPPQINDFVLINFKHNICMCV